MADFEFFLTKKQKLRRETRDWLLFLNGLILYQQAGVDLGHAWGEVVDQVGGELWGGVERFKIEKGAGFGKGLKALAGTMAQPSHRLWLVSIADLYESGAGLVDGLSAFMNGLMAEERRDLENHCRVLPSKANIVLLLFFFPATMAIIFLPLLCQILSEL